MKYDDASWHTGGDFPRDSPDEYGATHIALFLKWCFKKGWAGELHLKEWPDKIQAVIDGNASAISFLIANCDGKLTDEDLSDLGNSFSQRYYGDDGLFLEDYAECFGDLMYITPEEGHDFHKFSAMIERRIESEILNKTEADTVKSWWKFW